MDIVTKLLSGDATHLLLPRRVSAALLVGLAIVLTGCDSGPSLGQVTGTVTYQGKPVEKGTIIFEVPGTRSSFGKIENGQIVEVSTFESGDGVPIGEAKVAVNAYDDGGAANQQASPESQNAPGGASRMVVGKNLVPAKYSNPATSQLQVTIQPGENVVELDLLP